EARLQRGRAGRSPLLRFQAIAADANLVARDLSPRLAAACRTLDELIGAPVGSVTAVRGELSDDDLTAVPATDAIAHPRLEAARRAVAVAERALDSAAAEAWPNLTVGLGYEREQLTDEDFLGLYFKMPLPIWNRNQGQHAAAEAALRRARTELAARELEFGSESAAARLLLDTARASAESYRNEVLPRLDEAHRLTEAAWHAGRSSRLEVLDARLALIRGRRKLLDHLERWAKAAAEVRYLGGRLP
ncbi:MAG: TolC family protein, partial [Planctomycetes bacterium]|nr:TolC family protein [Planctomycetota bacterium]